MKEIRDIFGERLREFREEVGWTQETLAEKAELAVQSIGLYERGEVIPGMETCDRIVAALKNGDRGQGDKERFSELTERRLKALRMRRKAVRESSTTAPPPIGASLSTDCSAPVGGGISETTVDIPDSASETPLIQDASDDVLPVRAEVVQDDDLPVPPYPLTTTAQPPTGESMSPLIRMRDESLNAEPSPQDPVPVDEVQTFKPLPRNAIHPLARVGILLLIVIGIAIYAKSTVRGQGNGREQDNTGAVTRTPIAGVSSSLMVTPHVSTTAPYPSRTSPDGSAQVRLYDFYDHAEGATWETAQGKIALTKDAGQAFDSTKGFAARCQPQLQRNCVLEDGSPPQRGFLLAHPNAASDGYIAMTSEPIAIPINRSAAFVAQVGFLQGMPDGDVTCIIEYRPGASGEFIPLWQVPHTYAEQLESVDVPLPVNNGGFNIQIRLSVRVNSAPESAWIVWVEPQVVLR